MSVVVQSLLLIICLQQASGQCPLIASCQRGPCTRGERFNPETGDCQRCENNTYVTTNNHSCTECTPCTGADSASKEAAFVVLACSAISDTIIDCARGFYKVLKDNSCQIISCRACTQCAIWQTEVSSCGAFNDTVCAHQRDRMMSTTEGKPRLNAIIVGSVTTVLILGGVLVCIVLHRREKRRNISQEKSCTGQKYVQLNDGDQNLNKSGLEPGRVKWIHA